MNLNGQDWEPVIVRKKAPTSAQATSSKAVNAAIRAGAAVETVKKHTAGANKPGTSGPIKNAAKLENETEVRGQPRQGGWECAAMHSVGRRPLRRSPVPALTAHCRRPPGF